MSRESYKLRAIVAREPDYPAQIVAAISESTWENMPPEEWDSYKRKMCEEWLGPDWTIYDFAEAVLDVPQAALDGLFSPAISVTRVEVAPDEDSA